MMWNIEPPAAPNCRCALVRVKWWKRLFYTLHYYLTFDFIRCPAWSAGFDEGVSAGKEAFRMEIEERTRDVYIVRSKDGSSYCCTPIELGRPHVEHRQGIILLDK